MQWFKNKNNYKEQLHMIWSVCLLLIQNIVKYYLILMSIRSQIKISSFQRSHPLLKKKSVCETDSIREAVIKYEQAIRELPNSGSKVSYFQAIQRSSSPFKDKKITNFTIMAKLKHLQNAALINNAQHERSLRDRNRLKQMGKSNTRKIKNWTKVSKNLNQTYLDIYNKFIHNKNEIQSDSFLTNLLPETQTRTQTESSYKQNESCLKLINYKEKLKPYRKFCSFIRDKIIKKQNEKYQSQDQKRRAQSLEQFKSHEKNISKQYFDIAKLIEKKQLANQTRSKQICDSIVDKTLCRIFKKSSKEKDMDHSKSLKKAKQRDSIFLGKQSRRCGTAQNQRKLSVNNLRTNRTNSNNKFVKSYLGQSQRKYQKRESKSASFNRQYEK